MEVNMLPVYDDSDNPTDCCPRFKKEGWEEKELHFEKKLFVKAVTRSLFHIPLNMGRVFPKTFKEIEGAGAMDLEQMAVFSTDISPWRAEHLFAVKKEVPGLEHVRLTGNFITRVFEGPYKNARHWYEEMKKVVKEAGKKPGRIYFYYTTCPKCASYYGKNYVVGIAEADSVA
ncbi:MAG: hypothetical protein GVY08_04645 [Bacteroidetes bacterium]|jgi:hypothetical protein|nr:hypothetical protein [Bacteroidota bacterium]